MRKTVLFTKEQWGNSILSTAGRYGGITIEGKQYIICDKRGATVFECSNPKSKYYVQGEKAIPKGEPADLVLESWIPVYKKLGRKKMLEVVRKGLTLTKAKEFVKRESVKIENKIEDKKLF